MTERIDMIVSGRLASVPKEHAKKIQRKQELVAQALNLQNQLKVSTGYEKSIVAIDLQNTMSKIIRINRSIPPCVKFYPK